MAQDLIVSRKEGAIGRITLNRPEAMNTFTIPFAQQLDAALWSMEKDRDIRVVIIDGAGRNFCTGISLDQFPSRTQREAREFLYQMSLLQKVLS
jgi:enoyl-CoA hydratase/carnithine racemase